MGLAGLTQCRHPKYRLKQQQGMAKYPLVMLYLFTYQQINNQSGKYIVTYFVFLITRRHNVLVPFRQESGIENQKPKDYVFRCLLSIPLQNKK